MTSAELSRINVCHNQKVLDELGRGDLIEIDRGMFSHWAVYYGDGKVIHLTGDESVRYDGELKSNVTLFTISGETFSKAIVKVDDFWEVVSNSKAKKNNSKDGKMSPSDPNTIIARGEEKLGQVAYNLLWNNCEHFASFCRYGTNTSDQAVSFWRWLGLSIVGVFTLRWFFGDKEKK